MMEEGYEQMRQLLSRLDLKGKKVLDVGSLDVNGSFKPLVTEAGAEYLGVDTREGPGVDKVSKDPDRVPGAKNTYDAVISGYTLEHVAHPWLLIPDMVRVLKPGGHLIIITHHTFAQHRYPVDNWRFMPDGMMLLLVEAGLVDVEVLAYSYYDIYGIGRKPKDGEDAAGSPVEEPPAAAEPEPLPTAPGEPKAGEPGTDSPPSVLTEPAGKPLERAVPRRARTDSQDNP